MIIYWSLTTVVSIYFWLVSADCSFFAVLNEFEWCNWRLIFVFFTILVFFYLGFAATTLILLEGSCLKLKVVGNFCSFKLDVESYFFTCSSLFYDIYRYEVGASVKFCAKVIAFLYDAIAKGILSSLALLSESRPKSTLILPLFSLATFRGVSSL